MHDHCSHSNSHSHSHSHAPALGQPIGWKFAIATLLNLALVGIQVVYGLLAHSMALLADAGHNFGDAMGLALAWGAMTLGTRPPTARFTYGFRSASILAALANSILLLVATGIIIREAIGRFTEPGSVAGWTVIAVAAIGILMNGVSAALLIGDSKDINVRAAFLHLVGDAAVSGGVVVGGIIILNTGWTWIDPAISILIALIIVWGTWSVLREAMHMSLQAVPAHIDPILVRKQLEALPGIGAVHDLHIWSMSTSETALTCHFFMPNGHPGDDFLHRVADDLKHAFTIGHCTFQIEVNSNTACVLAPEHVV